MKADEFDTRFDNGEDMTDFLDLSQIKRSGYEQKSIDIDWSDPTIYHQDLDCRSPLAPSSLIDITLQHNRCDRDRNTRRSLQIR
jgi:hypothetical protein